ncbi:peptide MFS transporter [Sphingomonas pokkalii]|uniref:MFS transporter n=1 Tax=Sphingomonas pokkalii TaxID=2175090 RepID=A0A2U0SAJ2_9SPHN|nr:peptide MFS transporter [Sphingomonas pokkalii]PVX28392.1 MFS transporter [Sphingomonas pokkalii]
MDALAAEDPVAVPQPRASRPQQPFGLYVAAATEGWERFSYYGMNALVMLYMVQALLLPGGEPVYGMDGLRTVLETLFGPLSTQALASQILGLYAGSVYLTPLIGGYLADRWIGLRTTILAGLLLLTCGHLMMTSSRTFLIALLLLVVGSGLVKGNLSAQVGSLYEAREQALRTRGFSIFAMAVNIGALAGPLACGAAVQLFGWHAGFGLAAMLMLCALAIYMGGVRHLPDLRVRSTPAGRPTLPRAEYRRIGTLLVVLAISVFQATVYSQLFNVGMVWIEAHVGRETPLGSIPTPWFGSVDALASIVSAPLLILIWRNQAARGREPDAVAKIGIGATLSALHLLILGLAAHGVGAEKASPLIALLVLISAGVAFNFHWPPLVALVSMAAPGGVNALMINVTFLTFFLGNVFAGQLAMAYAPLGPGPFWLLHAGLAGIGACLAFGLRRWITRGLTIPYPVERATISPCMGVSDTRRSGTKPASSSQSS